MQRRRLSTVIAALSVVLAACGGGDEPAAVAPTANVDASPASTTTTEAPPTESTVVSTVVDSVDGEESTAPAARERPAPDPNREIAPDFSLDLGSGSTFVLSEETRPVFMVFWAEW